MLILLAQLNRNSSVVLLSFEFVFSLRTKIMRLVC